MRDQKPHQLQKKEMDHQTPEEDEEPRRAAETASVTHKLWRHLSQKYTHLREGKGSRGTPPANQADNTATGTP